MLIEIETILVYWTMLFSTLVTVVLSYFVYNLLFRYLEYSIKSALIDKYNGIFRENKPEIISAYISIISFLDKIEGHYYSYLQNNSFYYTCSNVVETITSALNNLLPQFHQKCSSNKLDNVNLKCQIFGTQFTNPSSNKPHIPKHVSETDGIRVYPVSQCEESNPENVEEYFDELSDSEPNNESASNNTESFITGQNDMKNCPFITGQNDMKNCPFITGQSDMKNCPFIPNQMDINKILSNIDINKIVSNMDTKNCQVIPNQKDMDKILPHINISEIKTLLTDMLKNSHSNE